MYDQTDFYNHLRDYLLSLSLKPGDRIETESLLAERFGVSRYKVQRTLASMADTGIVERSPRRGTFLKSFSPDQLSGQIKFHFDMAQFDIAEFTEARVYIECTLMPLAIRRMTPSMIAEARACIHAMESSHEDLERAAAHDLAFHLLLFKATGNKVIEAFASVLVTLFKSAEFDSYRREFYTPAGLLVLGKEHHAILDAIAAGDSQAAMQRIQEHLRLSGFGRVF